MNDRLAKFEQELTAMQPRAPGRHVLDSLERMVAQPGRRRGDWCLIGAIGSGLAAGCVIVAMISIGQMGPLASQSSPTPSIAQTAPQRAGDSLAVFAQANNDLGGMLK